MSHRFFSCFLSLIIAFGLWGVLAMPAFAAPTLTQSAYRFYVNEDSQTPTDPWPSGGTNLAENTPITVDDTPPGIGDVVRIRMNIGVTADTLVNQSLFRLQYGVGVVCSSITQWESVGGIGGNAPWNGHDNATPTDGDTLTSALLSSSNVKENYEEEKDSVATNNVLDGEYAEWDWVIVNSNADAGTHYCFRMVKAGKVAEPLDAYDDYPQLDTETPIPPVYKSQDWQWFGDEDMETPTSTLAALNTRPIGIREGDAVKLRVMLKEINGIESPNQKYVLEFDTTDAFLNPFSVEEHFFCNQTSIWCYADGVDTDDDVISTLLLPNTDLVGRHNEAAFGNGSTFTHAAYAAAEQEFTIESLGATAGIEYFFRVVDNNNATTIASNTGASYPSLRTREPLLSFMVEGLDTGTTIDGYTTNITTSASELNFGNIDINQTYLAGQRLRVTQDGLGYQVSVFSSGSLQSATGFTVADFGGTNAAPEAWSTYEPGPKRPSAFGYHPDDDLLSEGSTRFFAQDTWAGLTNTAAEIIYTTGAVEDDVHDILYRLEVSGYQQAQTYSAEIYYVVVSTY